MQGMVSGQKSQIQFAESQPHTATPGASVRHDGSFEPGKNIDSRAVGLACGQAG